MDHARRVVRTAIAYIRYAEVFRRDLLATLWADSVLGQTRFARAFDHRGERVHQRRLRKCVPVQLADEEGSEAEPALFPFACEFRDHDRLIGETDNHLGRLAAREKDG